MFTGLITHTTSLAQLELDTHHGALYLEPIALTPEIQIGESIAVDGCCLTLVEKAPLWRFDLLEETLDRTRFKSLKAGSQLNIERALTLGAHLGGHIVTGHIDCVGKVLRFDPVLESPFHKDARHPPLLSHNYILEIETHPENQPLLVEKGSITINGISLTLAKVHSQSIILYIIPYTRTHTNLLQINKGDLVNMEFDLFAKLIQKNITHHLQSLSKT
jgi:riboflavin synthase